MIRQLCFCLVVWGLLGQGMAQESSVHPVDPSPLKELTGFAGACPADLEIAKHPAVIFSDDFEVGELGAKWDETRNPGGTVLSTFDDFASGAPVGHRSVRVTSTLGRNTGGGFTKWFESSDRLFIRFYTKFDANCDYVHHFCTLRANQSLRGGERWSGFGGAGVKPDGATRFSTAIEPWGNWGKLKPPGQWNFYSYWSTMKASPDGKYWGNSFLPESQPNIPRDQWICVELMLQHNTPGQADGEQACWIDGQLTGHWGGFNWRSSPTLFANAFTLESYVTDRWTRQPVNIVSFDNVVIAREYIGPAGSSLTK